MTDRAMKTSISEISEAVITNKKVLGELQASNKVIQELLHVIYQRVEDMSMKFDETLNVGIKKPKVVTKNTTAKKTAALPKKKTSKSTKEPETPGEVIPSNIKLIKNIMTYFKNRFVENNAIFDDILEENQAQAVFTKYAAEIAAKKEGPIRDKAKATMLYQNITDDQKAKIRAKMMDEYDRADLDKNDDIAEEAGSQSD